MATMDREGFAEYLDDSSLAAVNSMVQWPLFSSHKSMLDILRSIIQQMLSVYNPTQVPGFQGVPGFCSDQPWSATDDVVCTMGVHYFASKQGITGWWFRTFFIFPYIGNNHPNWLIFFRGVGIPSNQIIWRFCCLCWRSIQFVTSWLSITLFRRYDTVWSLWIFKGLPMSRMIPMKQRCSSRSDKGICMYLFCSLTFEILKCCSFPSTHPIRSLIARVKTKTSNPTPPPPKKNPPHSARTRVFFPVSNGLTEHVLQWTCCVYLCIYTFYLSIYPPIHASIYHLSFYIHMCTHCINTHPTYQPKRTQRWRPGWLDFRQRLLAVYPEASVASNSASKGSSGDLSDECHVGSQAAHSGHISVLYTCTFDI